MAYEEKQTESRNELHYLLDSDLSLTCREITYT